MKLEQLSHVNLRTTQLDAMIDWYTDFLGMHSGDRPNFSFPGAWMYVGDNAVVHLIGVEDESGVGSEEPLKLEHFGFAATGGAEFEAKLRADDTKYSRNDIPDFNLYLINLWDPDGNHLHLDFHMDE